MIRRWENCYRAQWGNVLVQQDAFAHPAKFARALIERIVQHGFDQSWWKVGDLIADPFAGIGTGGIIAAHRGLRWIGVELERRFCRIAAGYDCPGLSREEWRRWFGRYKRCAVLCPRCQDEAGKVRDFRPLLSDGDGYCYADRHIPWIAPHHYTGNLEGLPGVCVVQGDSREFAKLIGQCDAVVTSPPYGGNEKCDYLMAEDGKTRQRDARRDHTQGKGCFRGSETYGTSPGQIGRLKPGDVDAVITSPPYAESIQGPHGETETAAESRDKRRTPGGSLGRSQRSGGYGEREGQIGRLRAGDVDAVITSPPWAAKSNVGGDTPTRQQTGASQRAEGYGTAPGQIGRLKPGDVDAVITSPPYAEGGGHRSGKPERDIEHGKGIYTPCDNYAATPGQIGQQSGDTYWAAVAAVYEQCRIVLKPGGMLVVVTKDYVRDKQRVPLCDDTWKLLGSLGFSPVERIRAHLVETDGQPGLFGEPVTETKKRKSFFRQLAEDRGSPPIDYEEVLCVRRPG
jgi:DNA modification methylase